MRVQNWRWAESAFTGSGAIFLLTIVFRAVSVLFFSLNYSHCGQRLVGGGSAVIMAFGVAWQWFISHGLGLRSCLDSPLGVCLAAGGILLGWSGTHNTNLMHILFFFLSHCLPLVMLSLCRLSACASWFCSGQGGREKPHPCTCTIVANYLAFV